jgi:hypothetical protein
MIGLEPGKVPRPVVPPGKSTRTNESRVEPGSSIFGGLPASAIEALRNLLVVIGPVASSSTTIPKLVGTPRVAVTTIISDAGSAVLAEIIDLLEIIARTLKLVGVSLQIGQVEQYANQITQQGQ